MNRLARVAAWLFIASFLGIVPRLREDLRYGQAGNFHMTTVQFEWFGGAAAFVFIRGSRSGSIALLLIGLLWSIAGAADHYRAFIPGDFRAGLSSRLWIWLLVAFQAAALLVIRSLIRRGRGH